MIVLLLALRLYIHTGLAKKMPAHGGNRSCGMLVQWSAGQLSYAEHWASIPKVRFLPWPGIIFDLPNVDIDL